jgi:HK97 family phage portal protein
MGFVERIKTWWGGAEGSYRGPAVGYSHWGNPFPVAFGDGFQAGLTLAPRDAQCVPTVYACVMATAKAIATCTPSHKVVGSGGRIVSSTTSPASRVLRQPNDYQSWPQFILNAVATMLFEGESFILIRRDERFAVNALHLMPRGTCSPYVDTSSGEVFYTIGANPMLPGSIDMMAPARDVIHLRQHTPRHPLIGESPIKAAALALGVNVALSANQAAFFANMNRPSGLLSVKVPEGVYLTEPQITSLRARFNEQAHGINSGGMPIMQNMDFTPMAISSQDAQLVEAQRMSQEEIARCFGVPPPMIGDLSKATLNNVESTINFWLANGLGSLMENLERSFDIGFGLVATPDYIEFDERALLRMDYVQRIDALPRYPGGVMSPNEARTSEGLPPVPGGEGVFLQRQMVSIDMLAELNAAEITAKSRPPSSSPGEPPAAPAQGEKGAAGRDGATIIGAEVEGFKLVLVQKDADGAIDHLEADFGPAFQVALDEALGKPA